METKNIALPPSTALVENTLYIAQRDIYALEASSGTVKQSYAMQGVVSFTVENNTLYVNVNNDVDHTVLVLRSDDGVSLWSYNVEGRLAGAPTVVGGVVYISILEGIVYALQASDGKMLWQYTVDSGADVPSFLGPILSAPLVIAGEIVYVAPQVNPPLEPLLYALQAKNGNLLWKAKLPESPSSFPPIIKDDVIYISTYSTYIALHALDGSSLWQHEMPHKLCSSSVVVDGSIYVCLQSGKNVSFYALQARDGILQWQNQLRTDAIVTYATTPVVTDNAIYIGADDSLMALRTSDGATLWRSKTDGMSLSSPIVISGVMYVGANDGCIYAVRTSNGERLWKTCIGTSVTMHSSLSLK